MWSHRLAAGVTALTFSPDGGTLFVSDYTGRLDAWDTRARTRRLLTRLTGVWATNTHRLAVTGDGRFLVAWAHQLLVWELAGPTPIDVPERFARGYVQLDAAAGRLVAVTSAATGLLSWDLASRKRVPVATRWEEPMAPQWKNGFQLSADGRTMALRARSGQAVFRELPSGAETGRLAADGWTLGLLLSPDGRTLYASISAPQLWNVPAGTLRCAVVKQPLAFHPTAPLFAGRVRRGLALVSSETGKEVRSFDFGLGSDVRCACFSPDGLTCAVGGSNGRFAVFDVDL